MSKRVLIVDDSDFARKVLRKTLGSIFKEGELLLTEAGDGEQALEILKNDIPDFMFLDLTMPVMDGYQLLSELKKMKIEIPTVIISADVQSEATARVKEMGVLGFLSKPLNSDEIKKFLSEWNIL